MAYNLREFLGLEQGSQAGLGDIFVMEKLLEHYTVGHDSDDIFENPKFGYNPENPSEAILKSDDTCFALTIDYDGQPPAPPNVKATFFPYTLPMCFSS